MTGQKLYYAASAVYNYWAGGDPALKDRMEELRTILDSLREAKSEIAIPPDRIHACPKCGGYTSPEAVHKCEGECTCLHVPEFETPNDDYATKMLIDPACPLHGAPERKEDQRELGEEDILQVGDYLSWDGVSRMPASPVWFGHPVRHLFTKAKVYRPAPARQGEEGIPLTDLLEINKRRMDAEARLTRALDAVRMCKDAIGGFIAGTTGMRELKDTIRACKEVLGEEKK